MTEGNESAIGNLYDKLLLDPTFEDRDRTLDEMPAVRLLAEVVPEDAYLSAEKSPAGMILLTALTTSHFYSVEVSKTPTVTVEALNLVKVEVSGEFQAIERPWLRVVLFTEGTAEKVIDVSGSHVDRRQVDGLRGLLAGLARQVSS